VFDTVSASIGLQVHHILQAKQVEEKTVDYNPDFISRMIPRIEWPALVKAVEMVSYYYDREHHTL